MLNPMKDKMARIVRMANGISPEAVIRNMEAELHGLYSKNLSGFFEAQQFSTEEPGKEPYLDTVGIGRILERMTELVDRIEKYKEDHGMNRECLYCRTGEGYACDCV